LLSQQAEAVSASGGVVTNYAENGTNFVAHIFTNTASSTSITFTVGGSVEVLIVAGGGAGGKASTSSGGGGAGGLIYSNLSVTASAYTIIVGSGSVGRTTSGTGASGGNSTFGDVTATGGGGGGGSSSAAGNGGSGGGARDAGGTGIAGQGKDGGSGTGSYVGGGGGAGSKGTNGVTGAAGHGGLGLAYSLSGVSLFYAGGGGGCYSSGTSGTGGSGVGGNGGATPGNGMDGRGGGGGGGGSSTSGNGGSGVVIVRYVSGGATTNTYTISYATNGATSGTVPASQTKTQDVTLVLATNVGNLERTGYTFSGWNTESNGTGTAYAEGANYTANTGAVMYAYWITNTPPSITAHPTNITVSVGQTATFNVTATGSPTLAYQWYTNDVAISGAVGTSYTTSVTTLSDSGKVYKVVVTNSFGTATSSDAILFVFATNNVPNKPIIVSPANQATGVSVSPNLTVEVSDPDGGTNLSVVFYGREYSADTTTPFTIVHISDSQMYYMQDNMAPIGQSIADWVVSNRVSSNIVAAYQVGDVVQNASDAEFIRSTNTYYRLSNTNLTGSPSLPWTIIGAAHDTEAATRGIFPTWNKYYGTNYFADKPYWGGCYNGSNEHNYILFSAGGLDFIILGLSQYADENPGALTWATNVLKTYSNRRALVVTHSLLYETTRPTPSTYSAGGPGIWTAMKTCSNVFMITGGHNTGHGWRDETNNFGQIVPLLTADYQNLADGGSGYFRLMRFYPSTGVVDFWTYSAYKTNVMTDDILVDSKFSITNSMLQVSGTTNGAFVCLGTNTAVSSGQQTSKVWSGLTAGSTYQWYAVVSDGMYTNVSDSVTFTVSSSQIAGAFLFFRFNTAVRVGSSAIRVQGEIK
jgi:hypothetical protein